MKINNLTPFASERLRAIARRVVDYELDPDQRGGITIHFTLAGSTAAAVYKARDKGYYQRASGRVPPRLKFNQAIVRISREDAIDNPRYSAQRLAHNLAHELAEMRGLTHEQMKTSRYMPDEGWEKWYEWARELPLVLAAKKPGPTAEQKVEGKLRNAHQRLSKAATRAKRAQTIKKKWERKVRYYESRLVVAANARKPAEPTQ